VNVTLWLARHSARPRVVTVDVVVFVSLFARALTLAAPLCVYVRVLAPHLHVSPSGIPVISMVLMHPDLDTWVDGVLVTFLFDVGSWLALWGCVAAVVQNLGL
jgi:hypothetical protein